MTAGQLQVVFTVIATLVGVAGVWLTVRQQGRARVERAEDAAKARRKEMNDARQEAYNSGTADARRDLQPQLDLARYERDAAVRERDRALRELGDCERRVETLEDEIRRNMRGGNGK